MKIISALLAGAAIAAASVAPAEAQRVNRIVALGDSYVDDGNVFELTGTPRPPLYPLGRFSNGTNFIDTMAQALGVPVLNYGVGGAVARAANTNLPTVQAFELQYRSFLAGGGPAAFPRSSGTLAPDDLLVVNIGANDARAYSRQFGVSPTAAQIAVLQAGVPAQAQLAATDAIRGLDALVAAGARNMLVLGGNTGQLPEVRGLPAAAVGNAYSTAYNGLLRQALGGYANQGVIVNYLDLTLLGDQVEKNLAAFGLTSAGACPIACVTTNPELLDRYLFYVDQVHLTQAGFAIVGRYALRQLEAPLHLEAAGDMGLQAATSFQSTLVGRLNLSDARFGTASERPLNLFLSGNTATFDRDASQTSLGYDLDTSGVTGGVEYSSGGAVLGVAGNWARGKARFSTASGEAEADGWQVGAYGGIARGGAFAQAQVGYGWLDYRTERDGVIDTISGDTEGTLLSAGAQAGFLVPFGALRVGPVAGVTYARAEIDGFREAGDPVLTLALEDQEVESLVGSLGIEARGDFDIGGLAVRPYAAAAVEQEFEEDGRIIRFGPTAAPEIVNRWAVPGAGDETRGRITAGADLALGRALSLQVNASTTIGSDAANAAGFLGLRLAM